MTEQRLVSAPERIADYLMQLLGDARPRRVSQMFDPGGDKYRDLAKSKPLTSAMLLEHAAGVATYAASLECGRIGAADIDRDNPEDGKAELMARYRDIRAAGLQAIAIYVENELGQHYGGHIVGFYAEQHNPELIAAQWRSILPTVAEIWPCGQVIRLPFGYHRWAKTRGELWYISDAGELLTFDLDTDLESGFSLVEQLPTNTAPPPLLSEVTKTDAHQHSNKGGNISTLKFSTPGRVSLADVKARFAAEYTIEKVLDLWGKATETRDGWACACGVGHTHETTLYISKKGRLFSYSPRCHLHTTKGWDAFGLYVKLFHNDNVTEAAKALNPIEPRKSIKLINTPTPEQEAEAARKRAQRLAEAATTLAEVQARASQDISLTDRAQLVLLALLETAGTRDWTRASVARIAEMCEMCERYTHEALRELEDRAYITSGRRNGSTTFRTFVRLQGYVKCADEYIYIACEGGASLDANARADTLDAWQWSEDTHGADEIPNDSEFEPVVQLAEPEAVNVEIFDISPTLRHSHGRYMVSDGVRFGGWAVSAADAWAKWEPKNVKFTDLAELEAESEPVSDMPSATYTPIELPHDKPYSGITKHTQDTEARYTLVWASMQPRIQPAGTINLLATVEPDDDMPTLRTKAKKERTPALDRYLADIARMSDSELAGELRKHKATLKKHSGAHWLHGVRDRLALVEQEIDARDVLGGEDSPPSQAPPVGRAAYHQQGVFL